MLTTHLLPHPSNQAFVQGECTSQVVEGCIAMDISNADMFSSKLSDHQLADLFLSMQLILRSSWKRDT
jgi:hypothetical protein